MSGDEPQRGFEGPGRRACIAALGKRVTQVEERCRMASFEPPGHDALQARARAIDVGGGERGARLGKQGVGGVSDRRAEIQRLFGGGPRRPGCASTPRQRRGSGEKILALGIPALLRKTLEARLGEQRPAADDEGEQRV